MYRPPKANLEDFLSRMEIILNYIASKRSHRVYICGDMNINILNGNDAIVTRFKNLMHSYNLSCVISKPTRLDYKRGRANLLDHVWTNDAEHNILNNVLFDDISDHFATYSQFEISKNNETKGR